MVRVTVRHMPDPWELATLVRRFEESADFSETRAPLNSALARIIASDRSLASLLAHAPAEQQLPVLLLAAIHYELLADRTHDLAAWYPNLTEAPRPPDDHDLARTLSSFVGERRASILDTLATRHVQTNEVGRCALLVAGLGDLTNELAGRSLAHLDVGTSAGLNLLLDRVEVGYENDEGSVQLVGSSRTGDHRRLSLTAEVRGSLEVPPTLPPIAARRGVDLRPIDLDDEPSRRWLEACVWPDQADRFSRLLHAIDLARVDPAEVVAGDAVGDLATHVEELSVAGVPLVTTTWVLNYLTADQRAAFVAELDRLGRERDMVWVFAEAPGMTSGLPHADGTADDQRTAVTRVAWWGGERTVDHIAIAHPHGYWLHAED